MVCINIHKLIIICRINLQNLPTGISVSMTSIRHNHKRKITLMVGIYMTVQVINSEAPTH